MSFMFLHCSSLTSLNLSNFNTQKVTDMEGMFSYCKAFDLKFIYTRDLTILKLMKLNKSINF